MSFCNWATGLARGFTCYEDRVLSLRRFKMVKLADLGFQGAMRLGRVSRNVFHLDFLTPIYRRLFGERRDSDGSNEKVGTTETARKSLETNRFVDTSSFVDAHKEKYASMVNAQFLAWLKSVRDLRRPFFGFLNYYDAHDSYILPDGFAWRFGEAPGTAEDLQTIAEWYSLSAERTHRELELGLNAHDNCIAYLDVQIGKLIDELDRQGVLEHTLVIITSDHGEEFGEHGYFGHAFGLYQTQVHVPLVILLPGQAQPPRAVNDVVSLRDVASTVVDLVGLESGSPFPGRSLAHLWNRTERAATVDEAEDAISELDFRDAVRLNSRQIKDPEKMKRRGQIVSLAAGRYVYMQSDGDHREELYDFEEDPQEKRNLVEIESMREVLDGYRRRFLAATRDITNLDHIVKK